MDTILLDIIIGALLLFIISYLISVVVLTKLLKVFRVENASIKKSSIIVLIFILIETFINIIFSIANLGEISGILSIIVFYYLLKRYYQIDWKKALGIYIAFSVAVIILSLLIVIPWRTFVAQPFYVNGNSMNPNYNQGDYMLIGMFNKQFIHGDVVVFRDPTNKNNFLFKRIIGLPGEKVEIKNGQILINGQVLKESYLVKGETSGEKSILLRNDEYFVLGDNREASFDSRSYGPIENNDIIGKIIYNFAEWKQ